MRVKNKNKINSEIKKLMPHGTVSGCALVLLGTTFFTGIQQASAQQLQEIIINAERREANLQETPISVAVLDEAQIDAQVIRDLYDIAGAVPNLNISSGRGSGPASPGFNIRGIGGGGVALYIDEIYFPDTSRSALRTTDLESLEVLRGPQGTLFGRNSTGGAIRVTTRKPNDTLSGDLTARVGNYGMLELEGMINVPLSDNVFLKGEYASLSRDGYVKRFGVTGDQAELGDVGTDIGSLALRWLASDNVTVDIKGRYEKTDQNPVVRTLEQINVSSAPLRFHFAELDRQLLANGQPALVDNDPRLVGDPYTVSGFCFLFDNDPTSFDNACATGYTNDTKQITTNVEWVINSNNTFAFNGGVQSVDVYEATDWITIGAEIRTQNYSSDVIVMEGLLNSKLFDDSIDLVTGINYFSQDRDDNDYVLRNHSSNQMADTRDIHGDSGEQEAVGIFSQGTYHFPNEQTNLTLGLRYTKEDVNVTLREWESGDFDITGWKECSTASSTGGGGVVVRDPNCMSQVLGSESYNELDWKLGVDHRINDDLMIFGSASKAYRAGAFTHSIDPTVDPANIVLAATDPEKVVNMEVGFRSDWFDNRFRVNFTYFDTAFNHRQGARLVATGSSAVVQVLDIGDIDISGWELDTNLAITDGLTLSLATGFTDAQLANPTPPGDVNLENIPELSYNVGANYLMELAGGELSFNLNYVWLDERHSTPGIGQEDTHVQASYGLVNGNIQYRFGDVREWTAALSGSNLTDKVYGVGEMRFGRFFMGLPGGTNYAQVADRGAPRMIFASLSRAF